MPIWILYREGSAVRMKTVKIQQEVVGYKLDFRRKKGEFQRFVI
jgi:hypothetical protein